MLKKGGAGTAGEVEERARGGEGGTDIAPAAPTTVLLVSSPSSRSPSRGLHLAVIGVALVIARAGGLSVRRGSPPDPLPRRGRALARGRERRKVGETDCPPGAAHIKREEGGCPPASETREGEGSRPCMDEARRGDGRWCVLLCQSGCGRAAPLRLGGRRVAPCGGGPPEVALPRVEWPVLVFFVKALSLLLLLAQTLALLLSWVAQHSSCPVVSQSGSSSSSLSLISLSLGRGRRTSPL